MKTFNVLAFISLALCSDSTIQADTFGSGLNTFDIDFVTIGNPGNPADTTGSPNPAGSVSYEYRIGKYEISEDMINKANALGGLGITKDTRGNNKPATNTNWREAARFVNWLNTSSGSTPAYKFDSLGNHQLWESGDAGYDSNNLFRNTLARYFLPSVHEWYKAAYYDSKAGIYYDYPTGSDTAPIAVASGTASGTAVYDMPLSTVPADINLAGGASPYGTVGQGGNAFEWEETLWDLVNDSVYSTPAIHGGWTLPAPGLKSTFRSLTGYGHDSENLGFRIASVAIPEPTTLLLAAMGSVGMLMRRRRQRG